MFGVFEAILDGTLVPIDRVADQKPYYSGKHIRHGLVDALSSAIVMTLAILVRRHGSDDRHPR